ncbi:MAG: hypothetical protein J5449_12405, partial [Oscillospiraceae bacterium]|nr:hypothetical protein [Oscillospiraceae bacterium]
GCFAAGPMLQEAKWFDLWLRPRAFRMNEVILEPDELLPHLEEHSPVMLGLRTPQGKHAVVFEQCENGLYRFFNPVHEGSRESASLILDANELRERVEPPIAVGEVLATEPFQPDMRPLFKASVAAMRENYAQIEAFAAEKHEHSEYASAMDELFRPLLLDGVTMLELAGETELAQSFSELRSALLSFVRSPQDAPLSDVVSMSRLRELVEAYVRLIELQTAD